MRSADPEKITTRDLPYQFGPYTLVSLLGEGGMARVFKAFTTGDDSKSPIAIKIIRTSLLRQNPNLSQNLESVVEQAIVLEHPNIVNVSEFGAVNGTPYFRMAYLSGIGMSDLLKSNKRPDKWQLLEMSAQACEGLAYIHNQDDGPVVHRDIKPTNLFLSSEGKLLLLDVGIALAGQADSSSAQTGMSKGELGFFSPEQFNSEEIVFQTDIFCIGLLIYELVTEKRLLPVESLGQFINALGNIEQFVAAQNTMDKINESVPGLGQIVISCLKEEPKNRAHSANKLAKQLRRLQSQYNENHLRNLVQLISPIKSVPQVSVDDEPVSRPTETEQRINVESMVETKPPSSPKQRSKTKQVNTKQNKQDKPTTSKTSHNYKQKPNDNDTPKPEESLAENDIEWPNQQLPNDISDEASVQTPQSILKPTTKTSSRKIVVFSMIGLLFIVASILGISRLFYENPPEDIIQKPAQLSETQAPQDVERTKPKPILKNRVPVSPKSAPKNIPSSLCRKGWQAIEGKEIERGQNLFRKALKIQSNLSDAYLGLAYSQEALSKNAKTPKEALKYKKRALRDYRRLLKRKKLSPPLGDIDKSQIEGKIQMLLSEINNSK